MKTLLRVHDLTKKFRNVLAVKNISFEVFKGIRAVATTGSLPIID